MRRVVVTGIGLITPLGQGTEITWANILAGKSGLGNITTFDAAEYGCNVAGEVPRVDGRGGGAAGQAGGFDPDQTMSPKDQRRGDDFILYALAAAGEAGEGARWAARGGGEPGRPRGGDGAGVRGPGPPPENP